MTPSEADIERAAKAMCVQAGDDPDARTYAREMACTGNDRELKQRWQYWTPFARAALTAAMGEPQSLALGDVVEMHPDSPYAAEWVNTTMKVVSLRVEPDGRRWISVIEGNPRHRGNGFYDGEIDCIEEDHLRRVADTRQQRVIP